MPDCPPKPASLPSRRTTTHNVYVIQLSDDVRAVPAFAEANPHCRADKPCLYVGLTGLTPEQRFERHMQGIQACRLVRRFGLRLRPDLYARFNPMTYATAKAMEVELAERLRRRGFAVWQR